MNEILCCNGGYGEELGTTCAGFSDVPVCGKGKASERDDGDGEEDSEDADRCCRLKSWIVGVLGEE